MTARTPRGWMFTLGLAALAVAAALVARSTTPLRGASDMTSIEADSCFRYGRFECCVRGD
jgi:hypothetical protein